MLDCEQSRQLIEVAAAEELAADEQAALAAHLAHCEACRRFRAEVRLTAAVLQEAPAPRPPAGLAAQINSAALTHLRFHQRPLHQRALGSPAFFATCASLLCGAVICLLAIWRLSAVPVPDFMAVPVPGGTANRTYTRVVVPTQPNRPGPGWQERVERMWAAFEWGNRQPCVSLFEFHAPPRTVTVGATRAVPLQTAPLLTTPGPEGSRAP